MPIIKVWCLPLGQTEGDLQKLFGELRQAVVAVAELELKENDVTVLFPPDQMKFGLGEEIVVEVTGLYDKMDRTKTVQDKLAESIGRAVKNAHPEAKVEVFVYPFNRNANGFWKG